MRYYVLIVCLIITLIQPSLAQDDDNYQIAVELIAEAKRTNATSLDLVGLSINEIPPEIGELSSLEILSLSDNELTYLPSEIGNLVNLHTLDVSYNHLTSLPSEIRQLKNLCIFTLSANRLTRLPTKLAELDQLVQSECSLQLNGNHELVSPPLEVILQGESAIFDYLRHQAWLNTVRLIATSALGWCIIALIFVFSYRRASRENRKPKQKRDG